MSAPAMDELTLTLWTGDVDLAAEADAAGVDRIGCDLERAGKALRQAGWKAWLSDHDIDDVRRVRGVVHHARLFARSDPFDGSDPGQLEALLVEGVGVIMLPVAEEPDAIAAAAKIVAGRALLVALVETRRGAEASPEIAAVEGLDEICLGPNDLSASLGLTNRFASIISEEAEHIAAAARFARRPFSIAGIAAVDDTRLPVRPDLVYAQFARLGATGAVLGRVFVDAPGPMTEKVSAVRRRLAEVRRWPDADLDAARRELARLAPGLGRL
ncbi:MAG TPA: aldolase/citrate lyase family protein [Acidimicrobiia bacterium]